MSDAADTIAQLQRERDAMRDALLAYEAAHESLFTQCWSNTVYNTWGKAVDMTKLNEAHQMAGRVLRAHPANTQSI